MPPPTLTKKKKQKKNRGSGHLGYSESYPPIFFCNRTNTSGHRRARTHTHTHLQTQTHSSRDRTCSNSNILSFSLSHTHTHKHKHPLGGFTECPPQCPTSLLCRAHEIWLSCVRLTSILDKANPNLYAAWQAGTLSNANARDTLEVVALCGYFYKTPYLSGIPACGAVLERASWWRCLHSLHQSLPFRFLSLCPLLLLFIKAPRNNKSPRNWEHVMKS